MTRIRDEDQRSFFDRRGIVVFLVDHSFNVCGTFIGGRTSVGRCNVFWLWMMMMIGFEVLVGGGGGWVAIIRERDRERAKHKFSLIVTCRIG